MNKLQHLQYLNFRKPSRYADNITAIQSKPSLDLNFARNKSLIDNVTGNNLVTFTRASSGTYVGEDRLIKTAGVNEPRFDHNPTTGESLGLLVEEQRTNLWTYSADFANAAWTKVRSSITSNTIVAPDGTLTGDKLIASTDANTNHFVRQDVSVTSGTAYTQTIYAKAAEYTQIYVAFDTDNSAFAAGSIIFTLTGNGIAGTPGGTLTSNSITPVGNGWYRCQITATATATATGVFRIQSATGDTNGFTGNGTSGIFIWGAQLEAGSFPTSYIPTTSSAATRSADVASITGTNFSSWYRQDEGTVFTDFVRTYSGNFPNFPNIYQFNDGTNANEITMFGGQNAQFFQPSIRVSNTQQLDFVSYTSSLSGPNRSAHGFAANSSTFVANGVATATDTSVTLPAVNRLSIGVRSSQQFTGYIRRLTYFPQRLSNANLQRITQ